MFGCLRKPCSCVFSSFHLSKFIRFKLSVFVLPSFILESSKSMASLFQGTTWPCDVFFAHCHSPTVLKKN